MKLIEEVMEREASELLVRGYHKRREVKQSCHDIQRKRNKILDYLSVML